MIHEHMKNLMLSPRPLQRRLLFLPDAQYASNGEMYNANWRGNTRLKMCIQSCLDSRYQPAPSSPTQSTVSLLNTSRPAMRSMSYGARDEPPHRPQYHLNGLFHQPSLRSLIPVNEAVTEILADSTSSMVPFKQMHTKESNFPDPSPVFISRLRSRKQH